MNKICLFRKKNNNIHFHKMTLKKTLGKSLVYAAQLQTDYRQLDPQTSFP